MIKMRVNKKEACSCSSCGCDRSKSIEMFDICIGNSILTLCDACNEELLSKSLKAGCMVNAKLKTKQDMRIINARDIRRRRQLLD